MNRDPRLPLRTDKILVKQFVEEKLGPGWTTPTLWHGAELPPLTKRIWPLPFVVKANHGSRMNIFVRGKGDLNWANIEELCQKWLGEEYGEWSGEWCYRPIKRQLLIEPFLGELSLPLDYKLWVFNGSVELIQVDTDREHRHRRAMFDRNWSRLPFAVGYEVDDRDIAPPVSLARMIRAAEILVEDIPFVRVDFYEIGSHPRFGEMTFYPGSGIERFDPPEYDRKIGDLWG